MKILENFSNVKVLVVGDVMLDRYWWGNVNRISPEAPVPVVELNNTSLIAGGAANVAANVAGLGARPLLVGVVGDDDEARIFPELLNKSNISADFLVKIRNRKTTVKTRVVAHNQQVVRIDQETKKTINPEEAQEVWQTIERLLDEAEIIVISDYAKGVLTDDLLKRLITKGKELNKHVLVDPKGKNFLKYQGATLLTPNQREAVEAFNAEDGGENSIENCGSILLEKLSLEAILITQGENGMSLFQKNKETAHLNSVARKVYDVTGAGDTVIASLAVALAAGADFFTAASIANTAAGLVVEQIGTAAISLERIRGALTDK